MYSQKLLALLEPQMAAMANADYPRLAGLQLTTVTEAYKLITAKKNIYISVFQTDNTNK